MLETQPKLLQFTAWRQFQDDKEEQSSTPTKDTKMTKKGAQQCKKALHKQLQRNCRRTPKSGWLGTDLTKHLQRLF